MARVGSSYIYFKSLLFRILPKNTVPWKAAVIGATVNQELYDGTNPLGDRIRVGGARFQVVGVMEAKGQMLGFDLDDTVYIPVARAMSSSAMAASQMAQLSER